MASDHSPRDPVTSSSNLRRLFQSDASVDEMGGEFAGLEHFADDAVAAADEFASSHKAAGSSASSKIP